MSDSNYSLTLLTAAQAYLALGFSVIPLHGDADPGRAKTPAIQWGRYQQTPPTEHDLQQWFSENVFAALGIVTGRISRLVVLDFDEPELFRQFSRQYPNLAEQHVIQTRRGYHIYFQLPPNLTIPSRKGQRIDLLSDGRYVVARPSVINGHTYQLIRGGQPKRLNLADIQRINRFLQNHAIPLGEPLPETQFTPFSRDYGAVQTDTAMVCAPSITAGNLTTAYSYYTQQMGRNESLFCASLKARDAGWSEQETLNLFVEIHVQQRPVGQHTVESAQQRTQEAIRTIHSAFSRPARPPKPRQMSPHLPNSVREVLLKYKRTDVARTLEGLRLKGIQPGQIITSDAAIQLLQGIVGRDSIYHALTAQSPAGQPIFEQKPPSALPLAPNGAATDKNPETTKNCFIGRGKNPGKIQSGRKKRIFIMPSNLELCQRLGVQLSGSDHITLDDLATARQTRMAAHRELIKRRPGIYPRRWLARRVGVCTKTLDAYNRDIPINVKHLYLEMPITWSNLKQVPDNVQINGAFLVDETGKRYPPKRPMAAKLLSQGHSVTYKRQDANYYWYGEQPPNLSVVFGVHPREPEIAARARAVQDYIRKPFPTSETTVARVSKPAYVTPPTQEVSTALINAAVYGGVLAVKPQPRREASRTEGYRNPLPDPSAETLAQHVYNRIHELASHKREHISLATARQLVDQYKEVAIRQAMTLLEKRPRIKNRAGFLITVLRANAKPI